jgi:MoaA/NifB/PqqE/SkfB family radical SAM enzyme
MSSEVFEAILHTIPSSVRKIYLMKQGEPFLNPRLEEYVRALKEAHPDIALALHTNGQIATPNRVAPVMPYLDHLGFSVWGSSPQSYTTLHGHNRFDRVIGHLTEAGRIAANLGRDAPEIFIDYVRQKGNQHESLQEVEACFRAACPQLATVQVHWVYNFHGLIKEGNLQLYDELPLDRFPVCVFPWSSITVCHDGRVSYCFVEPKENVFLGDVSQASLHEIWQSHLYRQFRRDMAGKHYDLLEERGINCRRCSWLWCLDSQAPPNLCGGNSLRTESGTCLPSTKDLLKLAPRELIEAGLDGYLAGEISRAQVLLSMAVNLTGGKEMGSLAKKWLDEVHKVYERYSDKQLWEDYLERENKSLADFSSLYLRTGT